MDLRQRAGRSGGMKHGTNEAVEMQAVMTPSKPTFTEAKASSSSGGSVDGSPEGPADDDLKKPFWKRVRFCSFSEGTTSAIVLAHCGQSGPVPG